jgi:hypothetical protein
MTNYRIRTLLVIAFRLSDILVWICNQQVPYN